MPNRNSNKGNPASHRMSNPNLKARRARNWAAQEKRKAERRAENEARAARNRELRAQGIPTPHELKQERRRIERDLLRAVGLLPPIGTTREQWEAQKKAA